MSRSDQIGKLSAALARAQGAIEHAAKSSKNPHVNSRYADLASVMDACIPHLSANELAVVQVASAAGNQATVETILSHTSGEWVASALTLTAYEGVKDKGILPSDKPQAIGSAITYARRYGLAALVGVSADDDDGNLASGRGQPPPRRETAPAEPDTTQSDNAAISGIYRTTSRSALVLEIKRLGTIYHEGSTMRARIGEAFKKHNASLSATPKSDVLPSSAVQPPPPVDDVPTGPKDLGEAAP